MDNSRPPKDAPSGALKRFPKDAPSGAFKKAGPAESLIELDLDLMKLLARRARLLVRLRGGRDHAATPAAVKAEKEVRSAWEKNATRFSRDPKFARGLFSLLQELSVDSREENENRSGFTLAPAKKPAAVDLPAPVSVTATRLWAALAAARGGELRIGNAVLNDSLLECLKALNQIGGRFTWTVTGRPGEGTVSHARREDAPGEGPELLRFPGAVLYAGEDTLTLYLLVFLALSQTGKVRFTGGAGLKMADLSPLRRFLPGLGARFAHTVPGSTGLPASLEISGLLPDHVVLPADLPAEGIAAFLCAACTWNKTVTVDLAGLPARSSVRALAEVLPVLRACGIDDSLRGTRLTLACGADPLPASPAPAADPAICAYLLALPAFAGGSVRLAGSWPESNPLAEEAARLLQGAGLGFQIANSELRTALADPAAAGRGAGQPPDLRECDPVLLPLGLALAVAAVRLNGPRPAPLLADAEDAALVADFYARFGCVLADDGMLAVQKTPEEAGERLPAAPWTSPGPYWTMAYALCAYLRPRVQLANPAVMTELMPSFWALFNSLPAPPAVPAARAADEKPKTTRRRIVAS